MHYHSYLNTATHIIRTYSGATPLSVFLKRFFSADQKYGSSDRKNIAAICYYYYRLGKAVRHIDITERIILATFLCEQKSNGLLKSLRPEWNNHITTTLQQKLEMTCFDVQDIFPWKDELSAGIDHLQYAGSFLHQPHLFLRIRPGNKDRVINRLQMAGLNFSLVYDDCIDLLNSTKLDGIIEPDQDVVIQDYNSQKVLDFLKQPETRSQFPLSGLRHPASIWDCCAASGGKSILAFDILQGNIELTVSDIRENILANLEARFSMAGIRGYRSFLSDLGRDLCQLPATPCQLLICDSPCTGSGTWSRNPEQLFYFEQNQIGVYAERQCSIVSHVIPGLQKGGLFFYITCSVFRKENEAITQYMKEKWHLQLLKEELLNGYDKCADTMYVAVFRN